MSTIKEGKKYQPMEEQNILHHIERVALPSPQTFFSYIPFLQNDRSKIQFESTYLKVIDL